MKNKIILPISCLLLATACAPKNNEALQQIADQTTAAVGCTNFESRTWDAIRGYALDKKEIPTAEDLKENLKLSLKELKGASESLSEEKVEALEKSINDLYELLLTEAPQLENVQTADQLQELLGSLELGDQTTEVRAQLLGRVKAQFAQVNSKVQEMGVSCQVPQSTQADLMIPGAQSLDVAATTSLPLPVYGARFAVATAYQTCQALDEPIMSASTPDLAGVVITGKHSSGAGNKREISSVSTVLKTHPYYKNVNNYGANCTNPRTSPMIYDFGGKPYATTSSTSTLSFFTNAGSGTKVLGTDCSGFIYTALSTAGLRLKANVNNKASLVSAIAARDFMDPAKKGFSCLKKIDVAPKLSLTAGDIVATSGHIIMIDSAGADPFGLNYVKSANSCPSMSYKNFDFVVVQSSPSKGAVGINRYQARTYLGENDSMRATLEKYAYYACLAKFNNKTYAAPSVSTGSVVRHKMTSECLGTRVALAKEACISTCSQLKK